MVEVRSAVWLNPEHSRLNCILNCPGVGWIPFTADMQDASPVAKEIFANLANIQVAECVPPVIDLDVLRENKHQELKAARAQLRLTETVTYAGDTFGINEESDQANMNTFYTQAIAMVSGAVEREIFVWMSATNRAHTFTPEQIIQLATLMKAKVQEIYEKYWYARDTLLPRATTPEEIANIHL